MAFNDIIGEYNERNCTQNFEDLLKCALFTVWWTLDFLLVATVWWCDVENLLTADYYCLSDTTALYNTVCILCTEVDSITRYTVHMVIFHSDPVYVTVPLKLQLDDCQQGNAGRFCPLILTQGNAVQLGQQQKVYILPHLLFLSHWHMAFFNLTGLSAFVHVSGCIRDKYFQTFIVEEID